MHGMLQRTNSFIVNCQIWNMFIHFITFIESLFRCSICFNIIVVVSIPPLITQSPKHTSGNVYSTTNLTCKATGSPIPTLLWYKDDVLIPNDNSDPSLLLFSELNLNDRGFYHYEARSVINGKNILAVSSRILLTITGMKDYIS